MLFVCMLQAENPHACVYLIISIRSYQHIILWCNIWADL